MTNLAVAQKILEHMRVQGKFSVNENGACRYRSDDGAKCAAGVFIPDDRYEMGFEGLGLDLDLFGTEQYQRLRSIFIEQEIDMRFMEEMQALHDESAERTPFSFYLSELEAIVAGLSSKESP